MNPNLSDLRCPACGCELVPVLSKAEPIGTDGPIKATCHQCGRFTGRYHTQQDAIDAFRRGDWSDEPTAKPRGVADADFRQKPLQVPWTWGDYYAVRYLAGTMRGKLDDVAIAALRRGLQELARETIADHQARGKPVPQRLALLAKPGVEDFNTAKTPPKTST